MLRRYRGLSDPGHVDCLDGPIPFTSSLVEPVRPHRPDGRESSLLLTLPVRPAGPSAGTVPHESPPPVWFDLDSRRRPVPYIFLSPAFVRRHADIVDYRNGRMWTGDGTIFPKLLSLSYGLVPRVEITAGRESANPPRSVSSRRMGHRPGSWTPLIRSLQPRTAALFLPTGKDE